MENLGKAGLAASFSLVLILSAAALVAFGGRNRIHTSGALRGTPHPSGGPDGLQSMGNTGANRRNGQREGLRDVAMMLELIAAMLDSGAGIGRALELVASCSEPSIRASLRPVVAALAVGTDWETAWRSTASLPGEILRLKDALGFAALTGAPSASILYAQAVRIRREQFREAEQRAAALGVKLVIPLGLCSLPAFICLGVIPVLLAMLPSG
ncbi:type II secretion system F family protein [Arthrobacter sp. ISL-30]|uniref:type II secretion system F family protein n=1 Tax=Arthrobacter sp. ISL-30 TaxID=2819109 RepID=UPI001BE6C05A|nr:type II secretion system F family protein [Arthrobacter sp. ISL-30]MBT2515070.1 type II secretion system F family protein [Arthrobacter sp. ISL-30]